MTKKASRGEPAPTGNPVARPFKPHRLLFAILLLVNVLWIAFLVTEYFKTVHGGVRSSPIPATESSH
jgi:hypothetical protein